MMLYLLCACAHAKDFVRYIPILGAEGDRLQVRRKWIRWSHRRSSELYGGAGNMTTEQIGIPAVQSAFRAERCGL